MNLFSKFAFNGRTGTIGSYFTTLGTVQGYGTASVNTNTFIGILVLYTGVLKAMIIAFVFSLFSHLIFLRALNARNILYQLIYALLASGLFLGWFDYYFMQTFWYYLWIIFEAVAFLFQRTVYGKDSTYLFAFKDGRGLREALKPDEGAQIDFFEQIR